MRAWPIISTRTRMCDTVWQEKQQQEEDEERQRKQAAEEAAEAAKEKQRLELLKALPTKGAVFTVVCNSKLRAGFSMTSADKGVVKVPFLLLFVSHFWPRSLCTMTNVLAAFTYRWLSVPIKSEPFDCILTAF